MVPIAGSDIRLFVPNSSAVARFVSYTKHEASGVSFAAASPSQGGGSGLISSNLLGHLANSLTMQNRIAS